MKFLRPYTTAVDLSESPVVRRWGVLGARRFWLAWGAFMYGFLVVLSGCLISAIKRLSDESSGDNFFYLTVALIVIAASLLTRMLMQVLAELRLLEPSGLKKPGG